MINNVISTIITLLVVAMVFSIYVFYDGYTRNQIEDTQRHLVEQDLPKEAYADDIIQLIRRGKLIDVYVTASDGSRINLVEYNEVELKKLLGNGYYVLERDNI